VRQYKLAYLFQQLVGSQSQALLRFQVFALPVVGWAPGIASLVWDISRFLVGPEDGEFAWVNAAQLVAVSFGIWPGAAPLGVAEEYLPPEWRGPHLESGCAKGDPAQMMVAVTATVWGGFGAAVGEDWELGEETYQRALPEKPIAVAVVLIASASAPVTSLASAAPARIVGSWDSRGDSERAGSAANTPAGTVGGT